MLGLLGILAVLLPQEVGPPPVSGIEVTKPPWNFWWMFTVENWVGLKGILYGQLIFFGLLVILPFVDRNPERFWRRRPVAVGIAIAFVLVMAALTLLIGATPAVQHLEG